MSFTDNLYIFFLTVITISTTGVMMPGPVTAATIVKAYKNKWAGGWIALGHGVVEFPTIALMALGFSTILDNLLVSVVIGAAGGSMLVYMGIAMVTSSRGVVAKLRQKTKKNTDKVGHDTKIKRAKKVKDIDKDPFPYHPLVAGIITTVSNPYYFLWWATLGAALTMNAFGFGPLVLAIFALTHWSIDLGWDMFIGYAVNKSRRFWDNRAYVTVFALCGSIMILFGIWFVSSALTKVISI